MILRIYNNDTYLDIRLKNIYTEQEIIEAIDTNERLSLTREDDSIVIINIINALAIDIRKE